LCKQQGYFAKNYPKKKTKSAHIASQLLIHQPDSDINTESLYSEQSQPDKDTLFAFTDSSSSDIFEISDTEDCDYSFPIFTLDVLTNRPVLSVQDQVPPKVTEVSLPPYIEINCCHPNMLTP
jgi:hypothetical protein